MNLTARQEQVFVNLAIFMAKHGRQPSHLELAKYAGMLGPYASRNAIRVFISRTIRKLNKIGLISLTPVGFRRAPFIVITDSAVSPAPQPSRCGKSSGSALSLDPAPGGN